jgi:hypothetical protein
LFGHISGIERLNLQAVAVSWVTLRTLLVRFGAAKWIDGTAGSPKIVVNAPEVQAGP